MKKIMAVASGFLLDVIFPPKCLSCLAPIADQKRLLCERCMERLACNAEPPAHAQADKTRFLYAAPYEEPAISLIKHFKYGKLYTLEFFISAFCIAYLKHIGFRASGYVITAIPLHVWKERKRGFNQSEILARRIAGYFHVPFRTLLRRTRFTKPQARFAYDKRLKNVRGCFAPCANAAIQGKKIMLIDDVATTGATLREACDALRAAGAERITCFVFLKAQ